MGLLSIFQRNKQTDAAKPGLAKPGRGGKSAARQAPAQNPADTAEALREVRARARTRLVGATVLLLVGVIGFPLLFETQPRPIPVDLPIEIPARNAPAVVDSSSHAAARPAPALVASGPKPESVSYDVRPSAPAAASAAASDPAHRSAFASLAAAFTSSGARASDSPASAASVASAVASAAVAPAKPASKPSRQVAAPVVAPASKPTPALRTAGPVLPPPVASKPSPAAILADEPVTKPSDAAASGGRFVVQVGAFLEDAKVREARGKVEKLGLKTYTQPVDTPTGKRIRVRIGPYATKAEADKIAARLKADGLQAVVLVL